jgi:hypothetical protein
MKGLSKQQLEMLSHPDKYLGKAVERTEAVCAHWKKEL